MGSGQLPGTPEKIGDQKWGGVTCDTLASKGAGAGEGE